MKTARCFADVFQAPSLESGQHHLLAQRNASHQQQAPDQEEEKEGGGDAQRRSPRVLKFDVVRRKGKLNVLYKKCLLCVDDAQMALYMADIDGYGAIKPPAQLIPIEQILSARQIKTGKCAFQLSVRVYFFDGIHAARPNQEKIVHFLAATPVQAAEWVESINAVVKQRAPPTTPPAMTPSVMTPPVMTSLAMTPPPKPPKPMHMRPAHVLASASPTTDAQSISAPTVSTTTTATTPDCAETLHQSLQHADDDGKTRGPSKSQPPLPPRPSPVSTPRSPPSPAATLSPLSAAQGMPVPPPPSPASPLPTPLHLRPLPALPAGIEQTDAVGMEQTDAVPPSNSEPPVPPPRQQSLPGWTSESSETTPAPDSMQQKNNTERKELMNRQYPSGKPGIHREPVDPRANPFAAALRRLLGNDDVSLQ